MHLLGLHVLPRVWLVCGTAAALAQPAPPAPQPPLPELPAGLSWPYSYQNWFVACDNTRRCEAQGYHAEGSGSLPVMLSVTREPGAGRAAQWRIGFGTIGPSGDDDAPPPHATEPVALSVGAVQFSLKLPASWKPGDLVTLNPEQAAALLPALRSADALVLRQGTQRWTVSLKGANAALLKLDDLQGRVGTPSALARPGNKPESSVPPALPVPVVRAQPVPAPVAADAALRPALLAAVRQISGSTCEQLSTPEVAERGEVWRLPGNKLLVTFECWQAAYNAGSAAWIVNPQPPYAPQPAHFASLPMEGGKGPLRMQWSDEPSDLSFERNAAGLLRAHSSGRARGLGDCVGLSDWVWTGEHFALTRSAMSTCQLYTPGGQVVTLWQAQVR